MGHTRLQDLELNDWHGVTDWHAAMPREFSEAYFRRWRLFVDGRAPMMADQTPETFLRAVLRLSGVRIGLIPAVASLGRCFRWGCLNMLFKQEENASLARRPYRFLSEQEEIEPRASALRSGALVWGPPAEGMCTDWPLASVRA